jgi:hypothetical protein
MKNSPQDTQILEQSAPSRRGFFMGAAAASAATLAVTQLPHMGGTLATPIEKLAPAPENGGGYSLSEHVKRYYQTTRI